MPAQVLRANPASVTATFVDLAGATVDPGTVTVDVVGLDGTVIENDAATTSGSGANPRTYTLTAAHTADLDTLSVTFSSASLGQSVTETVEVIGALLFTIAEARAFDTALADTNRFPTATIEEARARITDEFETICGVSFVPRYRMDTFSGDGYAGLHIPQFKVSAIRSVESRAYGGTTWTAYGADDLADLFIADTGVIIRESRGVFVSGQRNIRVGYEHGFSSPPFDIKRAALIVCRYQLVEQNATERALSMTTEYGTTQLSTPNPDRNRWYGIPHVDATLANHLYRTPAVA